MLETLLEYEKYILKMNFLLSEIHFVALDNSCYTLVTSGVRTQLCLTFFTSDGTHRRF